MIQSPQDLRLGRRFTFQQVNEAKHKTGGLRDNSECPRETQTEPWLKLIQIILEGPENIFLWIKMPDMPQPRPAELVASYTRNLEAVTAD